MLFDAIPVDDAVFDMCEWKQSVTHCCLSREECNGSRGHDASRRLNVESLPSGNLSHNVSWSRALTRLGHLENISTYYARQDVAPPRLSGG